MLAVDPAGSVLSVDEILPRHIAVSAHNLLPSASEIVLGNVVAVDVAAARPAVLAARHAAVDLAAVARCGCCQCQGSGVLQNTALSYCLGFG